MRIDVRQFITRVTREVVNPESARCALLLARSKAEDYLEVKCEWMHRP
jgi:hypothetical protein